MTNLISSAFIVSVTCLLFACSSNKDISSPNNLYQALGEQQGIERLVDIFTKKLGQDKQILPYFAKASVSHFKKGFVSHLCDVSGGPCKYEGDNMVDIHTGMKINEADFNRVVELLVQAMEDAGINYQTQNQVLAKFAPLRSQIIKI